MSNDLECPYCGEGQDICHDDGKGYEEDVIHNQKCFDCGKVYVFDATSHYYYEAGRADCLNGGDHNFEKVCHTFNIFPDWVRCEYCGYEDRGSRMKEFKS